MWKEYLNNPVGRKVGDCAVRAISKALDMGWEAAYVALVINGMQMGDMPNSDLVSTATLRQHNFRRMNIPAIIVMTQSTFESIMPMAGFLRPKNQNMTIRHPVKAHMMTALRLYTTHSFRSSTLFGVCTGAIFPIKRPHKTTTPSIMVMGSSTIWSSHSVRHAVPIVIR